MPLKEFRADLHIHTCLSPCADAAMLPESIIKQAKFASLDIIGICDHNSTENVVAVKEAGKSAGIQVLGGIEISSREEVHIMGFFSNDSALQVIQEIIYKNLSGENKKDVFGEQLVVDSSGKIIGANPRLLIGAVNLGVEKIIALIKSMDGIAIASHIDRESFGMIGQLGFIPRGLELDALEVTARCPSEKITAYKKYGLEIVKFSDAHFLQDIGNASTVFSLNAPEFSEINLALHGAQGRKVNFS